MRYTHRCHIGAGFHFAARTSNKLRRNGTENRNQQHTTVIKMKSECSLQNNLQ